MQDRAVHYLLHEVHAQLRLVLLWGAIPSLTPTTDGAARRVVSVWWCMLRLHGRHRAAGMQGQLSLLHDWCTRYARSHKPPSLACSNSGHLLYSHSAGQGFSPACDSPSGHPRTTAQSQSNKRRSNPSILLTPDQAMHPVLGIKLPHCGIPSLQAVQTVHQITLCPRTCCMLLCLP